MTADKERSRIADALMTLSVDRRYLNTTLEMVLARAGVDEATFERYFDDLEDCFCQVLEAERDEIVRRVIAAYGSAEGWRNQMRAAADEMLAFFGEDLRRARFMNIEVLFAGDRAMLIRDEAMHAFFM